tara:strand:- start:2 stop:244 length:243 start_codon:yes stop_codon:yes gene_type:complete
MTNRKKIIKFLEGEGLLKPVSPLQAFNSTFSVYNPLLTREVRMASTTNFNSYTGLGRRGSKRITTSARNDYFLIPLRMGR